MSTDGFDEADFILGPNGIGNLLGGSVWKIAVPKGFKLPKIGGEILPYATLHFPPPIAMGAAHRDLVGDEASQPHLMGFTVFVHAESVDRLDGALKVIVKKLKGLTPSSTGNAGQIKIVGGSPITQRDASGAVERITQPILCQVVIGLRG